MHEGDYVLAINGQPLSAKDNPYRLLRTAPGQLVQLTVNTRPAQRRRAHACWSSRSTARSRSTTTRGSQHNRDYVAKASNGAIGYLHIPDMGGDGIREFIKWYYPQLRKQGLVVDVRDNGGGNVSAMIIERLSRKLLGLDYGRGSTSPAPIRSRRSSAISPRCATARPRPTATSSRTCSSRPSSVR